MRFIYSEEQLQFLRTEYRRLRTAELTEAFNARFGLDKSERAIRSALRNHRILSGRRAGGKPGPRLVTPEQADWMIEAYQTTPVPQLQAALLERFGFQVTQRQLRTFLKNHGITCPRSGCFEKGAEPWNKGQSFDAGGRSVETRFKPGARPQNWVPIGTEVRDPDGYLKRKVRDDAEAGMSRLNWKFVHVMVWEEHHGSVPDGHAVIFRNGDRSDIRLENLALVTRQELLWLNRKGLTHLPEEIHPTAVALAKLETTRHAREKEVA